METTEHNIIAMVEPTPTQREQQLSDVDMKDSSSAETAKIIEMMAPESTVNTTTNTDNTSDHAVMTPASDLSTVEAVPPFNREQTHAIIRQVEFYFSDQNLPYDSHLLGLTGADGNGPVSLSYICSFNKMRNYKPRSAIKNVLARSAAIDLVENGKKIKRRFPLEIAIKVQPTTKTNHDAERKEILDKNPHLTKMLLRPTGFEPCYADAPMTTAEYERDREMYDTSIIIWQRFEDAVRHYRSKRKFHQRKTQIFDAWMHYGGMDVSKAAFNGGDVDEDADSDKLRNAMAGQPYAFSDVIFDQDWELDFDACARGFLCSGYPKYFDICSAEDINAVCDMMVNFYNFLLYHDVCPEYEENIHAARKTVEIARDELKVVDLVQKDLCAKDSFNAACVRLFSHDKSQAGWDVESARSGYFEERRWFPNVSNDHTSAWDNPAPELDKIMLGVCFGAFATIDDINTLLTNLDNAGTDKHNNDTYTCPSVEAVTEELGLEIISIHATTGGPSALFFEDLKMSLGTEKSVDGSQRPIIPTMAIVKCRRWEVPHRRPADLPKNWKSSFPDQIPLVVNERILPYCRVGMKLQVELRKLDNGMFFIQHLLWVHPSFYVCLYNDIGRLRQMTIDGGDDGATSKRDLQNDGDQADEASDLI